MLTILLHLVYLEAIYRKPRLLATILYAANAILRNFFSSQKTYFSFLTYTLSYRSRIHSCWVRSFGIHFDLILMLTLPIVISFLRLRCIVFASNILTAAHVAVTPWNSRGIAIGVIL